LIGFCDGYRIEHKSVHQNGISVGQQEPKRALLRVDPDVATTARWEGGLIAEAFAFWGWALQTKHSGLG